MGGGKGWLIPPSWRSVPLSQRGGGVGGCLLPLAVATPALPPFPVPSLPPSPEVVRVGGPRGRGGDIPLLIFAVSPRQVLHPQRGVHAVPL